MAFTYKRLTEITNVPATAGAVFTNPSGKTSGIRLIVIHNGNTQGETVKLYNVPDSAGAVGTASDTGNRFYKENIGADKTVLLEFAAPGLLLEDENDTIQAVTDTASKVTIQIYGGQE